MAFIHFQLQLARRRSRDGDIEGEIPPKVFEVIRVLKYTLLNGISRTSHIITSRAASILQSRLSVLEIITILSNWTSSRVAENAWAASVRKFETT